MQLLDRTTHAVDRFVLRGTRISTRFLNITMFYIGFLVDRCFRLLLDRRPADFSINLKDLHRLEGHWAMSFSRIGTIHLPAAQLRSLGAWLNARSYLRVLWAFRRSVAPTTVRVFEQSDEAPSTGRFIRISDDYYGKDTQECSFFYPYVMHPWLYAFGRYQHVTAMRGTPRRFRLFFSGGVNDGYVGRFDFPILGRPAIVEFILETFRADACIVMNRSELANLRRTDRPIALVVLRSVFQPNAFNHYLTRENYLRLLARSDFALCPPGIFMPHSHNLIEAMAVGTIPVTNYPQYCRPKLVDGKTCLAFSTTQELEATIRRVLAASDEEVRLMRAEVARYYDEELSPDGTARKLKRFLEGSGPEYPLVINREFAAARLWSEANIQGH